MARRKGWGERAASRLIERRLGGYEQLWNTERLDGPRRLEGEGRVAVVGGGLAGIVAAATLAERGFGVDLFERSGWLGGKLGAWEATVSDGSTQPVEHGFHAFFRHYYNLNRFLAKTGADRHFTQIPDYQVLSKDKVAHSYAEVATTPVINVLSLARRGFYSFKEVATNPRSAHMRAMLEYDERRTFERYDHVSFAEFAETAEIPDRLMLSFNTFARAFFADAFRLSAAELLKSFHFYYLSQDAGLLYDYPEEDHARSLLRPFRAHLERHGVRISLGREVERVERDGSGFVVDGASYDALILAVSPDGARSLAGGMPWLRDEAPELAAELRSLESGQGYAVLRLWLDGDLPWEHVNYVVTERVGALDAVALYHRTERGAREHFERTGEAIVELHCYALPDGWTDRAVREGLLEGLRHYVPASSERSVVREHLYLRRDFAAFHVGMHARRPGVVTPVDGLYLAADWVRLPFPAMLMEASAAAGLLAANAVLTGRGLAEEPVHHVPLRGLLAPRRRRRRRS